MKKILPFAVIIAIIGAIAFYTSISQAPKVANQIPAESPPPETASQPEISIELLEAGSEPREELRMKFTEGTEQTMVMSMQMNSSSPAQASAGLSMPWIHTPMTVKIESVTASGDMTSSFSYGKVSVEPGAMAAQLEASMGFLENVSCRFEGNSRGELKSWNCETPENTPPQMKQMLDQMVRNFSNSQIMLPEEAVGVGAKWKLSHSNFELQGISSSMEMLYTLQKREDSILTLDVTMSSESEPQELKNPELANLGVQAKLLKSITKGAGTTTLDISKPLPIASEMKSTVSTATEITNPADGSSQKMEMDMEMHMKLAQP